MFWFLRERNSRCVENLLAEFQQNHFQFQIPKEEKEEIELDTLQYSNTNQNKQ